MKKLLSFIILSITICSLSFASNNVKINGEIKDDAYSLSLYYQTNPTSNTFTGNLTNYNIYNNEGKAFNLKEDGATNKFLFVLSGNQNKVAVLKITVKPEPFKPVKTANTTYKETDQVDVKYTLKYLKESSDLHGFFLIEPVAELKLNWKGNDKLTAGNYISNVTIEYSIT